VLCACLCALRLLVCVPQAIYKRARAATRARRLEEAACLAQRTWRGWLGRRRAHVVAEGRWRLLAAATVFTQRNVRRRWFWRRMATAARGRAARVAREAKARVLIQRWWRVKLLRVAFLQEMALRREEKAAATVIQANYRGHRYSRGRKGDTGTRSRALNNTAVLRMRSSVLVRVLNFSMYPHLCVQPSYRLNKAKRHARLVSHWGFFYKFVYHTTYKGQVASVIQTWCVFARRTVFCASLFFDSVLFDVRGNGASSLSRD